MQKRTCPEGSRLGRRKDTRRVYIGSYEGEEEAPDMASSFMPSPNARARAHALAIKEVHINLSILFETSKQASKKNDDFVKQFFFLNY